MNKNPEQEARDNIDRQLIACGWVIQDKKKINLSAAIGVAVREYQTDAGPADYILFVDKKPVGIIEAKREEEGLHLTSVEDQSSGYAESKLKFLNNDPLPFVYESTGLITRFTDYRDPMPRSRNTFSFHKPETFREHIKRGNSLRRRLNDLPGLPTDGLRYCQINAINNLEKSFRKNHPRALIQMATGSGKTYTAITFIYRLLKYARAGRVLFLVDTRNLGEQAEQEFMAYVPSDDNRKFTELYNVCRLKSGSIPTDNQVYISTIQRLYSILKGTELDESLEDENPNERKWQPKEVPPIEYNEKIPIEFFDFVVIDECHRSIYNLWKQVLEYFDAFQIGLTATPDRRTFGYFNQNIVSEYTHEQAVIDGVNVGYNVYTIETDITKNGAVIWKGEYVDFREKLTREKRWQQVDESVTYTSTQLDKDVVNPSQIRTIIREFRDHLPEIFPERYNENKEFEVLKTLIFAKTDSHADDIIQIVREVFEEGNKFCKKLTYRTEEDPKSVLTQFRNDYYPRIAVTVDMIATGTDVKPLECLLFMRDVRSRNYYEQMKGRGTRTISLEDLRKVTPSARFTKDHFVVVDAAGVTKSMKTDSRPLERKPSVPLKDLLDAVAVGARDEDLFLSLANRLVRMEKQLTEKGKDEFLERTNGKSISNIAGELINAYNPDKLEEIRQRVEVEKPGASPEDKEELFNSYHSILVEKAAEIFTGELNEYIDKVRRKLDQIIDTANIDIVIHSGFEGEAKDKAEGLIKDFAAWINAHKDEITALQIFYNQPYRRRELSVKLIRQVYEKLAADKPVLAPMHVWNAYRQLEKVNGSPINELTALVSLIRKVTGIDRELTSYDKTVDRNFQEWVFKKQAGALKFNEEQMQWLRMIKEHIAASFHLDREDFTLSPFGNHGGLGRMWELFGESMDEIINELNEELAA